MSACTKVLVTDLPETATREKVFKHFQNRSRNGGGEIKSLIYPIQRSGKAAAVVEFEHEDVAASVLQTQQAYRTGSRKVPLTVSPFKNELFKNVTAELDTATLKQYPTSEQILRDAGVKISESAEKIIVSGDWYKINFIVNELQKLTGGSNMQMIKTAISKAKRRDEKTDVKTAEKMNTTDSNLSPGNVSKGEPSAHKAIAASSPMSEVKSDYDGSLFSYTYLTRKEDVEAILYDYNVTVSYFRDVTGDVCVSWQSGSEGNSRFKKLYDQAMRDACQEFYDIPHGYDGNSVLEVLKEARRRNPWVQMGLPKGQFEGKILFIGENERACKRAFSDTEAIVNAANRRLADGAGVTRALYSAGEVKSDGALSVSCYDGSFFSYIYLTRKEEVEAILYDCNVTVSYFRDVTGDVCVSWQSGSEGNFRFKKLYDQAMRDACQNFYDIPHGYDGNSVLEALKEARRRNPWVQMELPKGQFEGKILLIGENERACKEVISDLRWRGDGRSTLNGITVQKLVSREKNW